MKKLIGMKKDFSSLENKKLSDLGSISGGRTGTTNDTWTDTTCEQGCGDVRTYTDGVQTGGGTTGTSC